MAAAGSEVTAAETDQQSLSAAELGNLPTGLTLLLQPTAGNASNITQNKAGTSQPDKSKLSEDEQKSKSVLKEEREKLEGQVDSLKERVGQRKEERMRIASNRERQMSRKTTALARVTESRVGLEKHRFCSMTNIF